MSAVCLSGGTRIPVIDTTVALRAVANVSLVSPALWMLECFPRLFG
ncbi:hypothetical protein QFZ49_007037 [Streptomyces turgidiscabies]|uniref:Uncharacterized protein n=1 Tax=Streptomyces turgidiscabies TaxID=85558 RepID=A0ABU0RYJ8_9ACTN|nr:hypothetical protein [Streptomyces turgidiscabies]